MFEAWNEWGEVEEKIYANIKKEGAEASLKGLVDWWGDPDFVTLSE